MEFALGVGCVGRGAKLGCGVRVDPGRLGAPRIQAARVSLELGTDAHDS